MKPQRVSLEMSTARKVVSWAAPPILLLALLRKIQDFDVWYHLSIGREVARTWSIPQSEFLVYMNEGMPGEFHEWGFGLLVYGVHAVTGLTGLSVLNALMGALTLWVIFRIPDRARVPDVYAGLAVLAAFWLVEFRMAYRPEVVLYLAIAIELYCLERFRESGRWEQLVPIPAAGLVLTQAHPSVLMMLGVLGVYSIDIAWKSRRAPRPFRRSLSYLSLCSLATLVAGAMNPYGLGQVLLPLSFAQQGEVLENVVEFLPTMGTPYKWHLLIFLTSSVLLLVLDKGRRLGDWLMLMVFGFLAFRYVRNVALLAIVMSPTVSRGMANLAKISATCLTERIASSSPRWVPRVASGILVSTAVAFVGWKITRPGWGVGIDGERFPVEAASMINESQPPGRIFNLYDFGGYLGWALNGRYQAFIDGRQFHMTRALRWHDAAMLATPGWQDVFSDLSVNTIVTPATLNFSGRLIPLVVALVEDDGWSLVNREPRALLFLRSSILDPGSQTPLLNKSEIWQQMISEAHATIREFPQSPLARLSLAEGLLRTGNQSDGIEALRQYVSQAPDDLEARRRLELLNSAR